MPWDWGKLSIKSLLRYLNLGECKNDVLYNIEQEPQRDVLKEAVASVLKSPTGRTGWIAIFKESVIKEADAQALLALNGAADVQRYVIPCGDRALLFVNKAMYEFWTEHLQKEEEITINKALTDKTDGFLPILFAASTPSSVTKDLTVAEDVCKALSNSEEDTTKLFNHVIQSGGGRYDWKIRFKQGCGFIYTNFGKHVAVNGTACSLVFGNWDKGSKEWVNFVSQDSAAEALFKGNDVQEGIDNGKDEVSIPNKWQKFKTRVPLGMVLEYVERKAKKSKEVLEISIDWTKEPLIEDLEAYLPKACNPNRPWKLEAEFSKDTREDIIDAVNALNQTALPYEVVAEKHEEKEERIWISFKKKNLSKRVEENGTLTLNEKDVAETTLRELFKEIGGLNKAPKATIKNVTLPFRPELYKNPWTDGVKHVTESNEEAYKLTKAAYHDDPLFPLKEAVVMLLERDLNADWSLTLDSKGAFDAKAFEKSVNETLKARNINRRVSVSPEGVITFEKYTHTPMPAFESEEGKIITSYDKKNKAVESSMSVLKWTNEWTAWFECPENNFAEFIEALAEHPEIKCVDFSIMPKDSVGHQKYLTEDAVKQLLKVNNVYFVCRCMPENTEGSLDNWEKWGETYRLSFVGDKGGIDLWGTYGDDNNEIKDGDGGWFTVYSKGWYAVSKTENGKRRLLWNKAALADILNTYDKKELKPSMWSIRMALAHFSGRENAEDLAKTYNNLREENKEWKQFMPYKPIDVIDFTIGDPKDTFKIGNKKYTWADVQKIVCSQNFAWAIKAVRSAAAAWTKDDLDKALKADDKAEPGKKLADKQRRELEEQLRIAKLLDYDSEVKERIKKWNQNNTKPYKRTKKIYSSDNKVYNTQDVTTNVIKGLQLHENVDFMEQWELINGNGSAAWKEADKQKLIKTVLGKQPIAELTLPALLERLWHRWEPGMREAFVKQWNEKHKNQTNKTNDTSPRLDKSYADDNQWDNINENWDEAFKTELTKQLKFVDRLNLLEQCQPDSRKVFVERWNKEYGACKCYELDAALTPVAQTKEVMKWKQCKHKAKADSPQQAINILIRRLSRLDYLMNFMAQWGEDDRKTFIEKWNNEHGNAKLLPDVKPFEQFQNIFTWKKGSDLRKKLIEQVMCTEASRTIEELKKVSEIWRKEKESLMKYIRCIRRVSILAYEDCIDDKQKQKLADAGWLVKPYLKKGKPYRKEGRNVVEIKYNLHSRSEWNEEEVKDVFNTDKKEIERKKKDGEQVFASDSGVFEDITERTFGRNSTKIEEALTKHLKESKDRDNPPKIRVPEVWGETGMQNSLSDIHVPTMKEEKDAFRFNSTDGLRNKYYKLPFGEFLESLKNAKKDLAKLDLTKFEDKGAKVSVDEFLKQPLWTFTVPINRLWELRKYEALHWIKISETKQNTVTFIVFPRLTFKRAKGEGNSLKWYLGNYLDLAKWYFDEFKQQLESLVRQKHPLVISLEENGYPIALNEADKFKAFFDTKTFRGIGFEFKMKKSGTRINFAKDVEKYNKNRKDVKHTLEWLPESETTCPAIYVRPEKWQEPSTPGESEKWLKEFVGGISRLTVLKESLKREATRILEGKSEPEEKNKCR